MRISDWSSDVCSSDLEFDADSRRHFVQAEFRVSAQSARMGYRLDGPALAMAAPRQILSEAANYGPVQLPAGGQALEIGRASCRESVCQSGYISVVAVYLKQKNKHTKYKRRNTP